MNKLLIAIILLLGSVFFYKPVSAQAWYKSYGNDNYNSGEAVSTDAAGNVYATGHYQGTINFGTTTFVGKGDDDIFIAKFDNSGTLKWAKGIGNLNQDDGHSIYTDPQGNSYITGEIGSDVSFDGFALNSLDGGIFLAKYDASGVCLWAHNYGSYGYCAGYGICSDGTNLYVTGYFTGTAVFGSTTLTSSGSNDAFIAKFDNSGNCLWAKKAGGSGDDVGRGIAYASGSLYVTGWFSSTMNIGSTSLTSSGSEDVFVAKYDLSGTCLWATKGGGVTGDKGYSITVDAAGNAYVAGYFTNNAVFGTTTYTSTSQDQFIAEFNAAGSCTWLGHSTSPEIPTSVIVDAAGHIYAAGSSYTPSASGSFSGVSTGLCIDNGGNVISTGHFRSGQFNMNIFVAKFGAPTAVTAVTNSNRITAFPNPASTSIFVSGLHPADSFQLSDITGRIVLRKIATKKQEAVDISSLAPGMYIIQAEEGQTKIIKE